MLIPPQRHCHLQISVQLLFLCFGRRSDRYSRALRPAVWSQRTMAHRLWQMCQVGVRAALGGVLEARHG